MQPAEFLRTALVQFRVERGQIHPFAAFVERELDRCAFCAMHRLDSVDVSSACELARRQALDGELADRQARGVLDTQLCGNLARYWNDGERQAEVVHQPITFCTE